MSDENDPGFPVDDPGFPVDDPGSPVEEPARWRRTRGVVLGSGLLAAAVLAGVGYTVVTVRGADRDPGAARWEMPEPAASGSAEKKAAGGSLRALFVPYGTDGFRAGPDIDSFGHDAEFNERQATALRAQQLKDMPRKYREGVEKHRIKSMALRTYLNREGWFADDDVPFVVQVTLTRLADRASVRKSVDGYRVMAASDVFDKGPVIKGHKDAVCLKLSGREREGEEEKTLGALYCTAGVGDLVVSFVATGADPLDTKGIAAFVAKQLDRIDDPGRAV